MAVFHQRAYLEPRYRRPTLLLRTPPNSTKEHRVRWAGRSHVEERDELQALEELLNATYEWWNVGAGGNTSVGDERHSSDSEAELAASIRQQCRTNMLFRKDVLLAELAKATTAVPPVQMTGERETAPTLVDGIGTSRTRQSTTVVSTQVHHDQHVGQGHSSKTW